MSTNDQLFATILLASGLLMSPDHRAQLVAITKGTPTAEPITITTILPPTVAPATALSPPPAPKKIKPRATAVATPIPMSLPPTREETLLAPVDLTPVTTSNSAAAEPIATSNSAAATVVSSSAAANTQYPNDALRTHRYRIAIPNTKFCMGRTWNEKAPLPGTGSDDATATQKMYPEQQCTSSPKGNGLCERCLKLEEAYMSNPDAPPVAAKRWRGRLDGPMFANAPFLGSDLFWKKYPQGLPGDPTTAAPAEWLAANTKGKAKPKMTTAATTTAVTTTAVTTVAPTTAPTIVPPTTVPVSTPVKPVAKEEWVLALIDDSSYIYERATSKCYEADMSITSSTKDMARMDRYVGKYESATNTINVYGSESDSE